MVQVIDLSELNTEYDVSENDIKDISAMKGAKKQRAIRQQLVKFRQFLMDKGSEEEIKRFTNRFEREFRSLVDKKTDERAGEMSSTPIGQIRNVINNLTIETLKGQKLGYQQLASIRLKPERFRVRGFSPSDLDTITSALTSLRNMKQNELIENLTHNFEEIYLFIEDELDVAEGEERPRERTGRYRKDISPARTMESPIDFDFVLGAVDVSKKTFRQLVYNHWGNVFGKYDFFKEALDDFRTAVAQEKSLPQEYRDELLKVLNRYSNKNLQYIVKFDKVDSMQMEALGRLYSTVMYWMILNNVGEKIEDMYAELEDRKGLGERDAQMSQEEVKEMQRIEQEAQSSKDAAMQAIQTAAAGSADEAIREGAELIDNKLVEDMAFKDKDEEVFQQMKNSLESIDPLLGWELKKDDTEKKLISISEEQYDELIEYIDDELDDIADGELKVTGTYEAQLNRWADELEDTTVVEEDEVAFDGYYLPSSVLRNSRFNSLYQKVDSQTLLDREDDIKDFLEDLLDALKEKPIIYTQEMEDAGEIPEGKKVGDKSEPVPFAFHIASRTTKGQPKGTTVQYGEALSAGKTMSFFRGDIDDDPSLAQIDEKYKVIIEPLKELIKRMTDYFSLPVQAGFTVINNPKFSTSRANRGFSVWADMLGLESAFGRAYEILSEGEVDEIGVNDLSNIAEFFEIKNARNLEITGNTFVAGQAALDSISEIFGENNREKIANEIATQIYILMNEVEDTRLENKRFPKDSTKTIKERVSEYFESAGQRRYLVALFNFLLEQQGVLTQDDNMKSQYERIMRIYEERQRDLPERVTKLLKAHDAIRKQLGKPVVYGFLDLNRDVGSFIDDMYHNHQIDLSNLEVENIVKSDDAHGNLSKEYGISKEQVYLIKASFRQ